MFANGRGLFDGQRLDKVRDGIEGDHTIERILEAAREAFTTDGVGVTLDVIARRAGVGPGTVHRHFPTKNQLYDAIVAVHLDELRREAQAALDGGDKGTGFFPYLTGLIGRAGPKQDVTEALAAAGVKPGPGAQQAAAELRDVFGALLNEARESGEVRSDVNGENVQAVVVAALAAQRYRRDNGRIANPILGCLRPQPTGQARGWAWSWTFFRRSMETWVYSWVVAMLAWPSSSCTTRRSAPPSSRWVAAECRNPCGPISGAPGIAETTSWTTVLAWR